MANQVGSVKLTLSFPGPGGTTVAAAYSLLPTFQASSFGQVDVPDATAMATAFIVPFGSIGVGATMMLLVNKTGQEMIVKIDGSLALNNLPDGGALLIESSALPASGKLTGVTLTTTAAQTGAGTVDFYVLGDPV